MSKKKFKITKEDFLKLQKAARRIVDLELGIKQVSKVHKTSKKDKKRKNTVRKTDLDY